MTILVGGATWLVVLVVRVVMSLLHRLNRAVPSLRVLLMLWLGLLALVVLLLRLVVKLWLLLLIHIRIKLVRIPRMIKVLSVRLYEVVLLRWSLVRHTSMGILRVVALLVGTAATIWNGFLVLRLLELVLFRITGCRLMKLLALKMLLVNLWILELLFDPLILLAMVLVIWMWHCY